jgi:holo-[acyl-carrier protein] synthase
MEEENALRKVVAEFFGTDPNQVSQEFPLAGPQMQGSLARAKLDAAIRRRVGVRCPAVYSAQTYGQLEAAVLGKENTIQANSAQRQNSKGVLTDPAEQSQNESSDVGLSCGIDIEMVESLPPAKDYWEDDFYKSCFTPAEIAYCLTQENPRIHFAARWCAKEALKKCDPRYLEEEMSCIELSLNNAGQPSFAHHINGTTTPLPHAVSVSHTPSAAVAVVVLGPAQLVQPESTSAALEPPTLEVSPASSGARPFSSISIILGFIALALSVWALVRTL